MFSASIKRRQNLDQISDNISDNSKFSKFSKISMFSKTSNLRRRIVTVEPEVEESVYEMSPVKKE
jgi:hypothetical protein